MGVHHYTEGFLIHFPNIRFFTGVYSNAPSKTRNAVFVRTVADKEIPIIIAEKASRIVRKIRNSIPFPPPCVTYKDKQQHP